MSHVPYCPSCGVALTQRAQPVDVARGQAQAHADVTGHVVQIVTADTWTVVESVPGAPGLPLWD